MCKISVIIPVYNTEQYLERCINSVLEQSFIDYEVILVDDESTDGSELICDMYETCAPVKLYQGSGIKH